MTEFRETDENKEKLEQNITEENNDEVLQNVSEERVEEVEQNITEEPNEKVEQSITEEQLLSSAEHYSEEKFWNKLARYGKKAGAKVVYYALLLYYAMQSPNVSKTDKMLIIGALGYLILPLDVIPDFIPVVGFTDDLGAIILALSKIAMAIDDNIKEQARAKMKDWFGQDFDSSELDKEI